MPAPARRHRQRQAPLIVWLLLIAGGVLLYQRRERLFDALGIEQSPPTPGATFADDQRDSSASAAEDHSADSNATAAELGNATDSSSETADRSHATDDTFTPNDSAPRNTAATLDGLDLAGHSAAPTRSSDVDDTDNTTTPSIPSGFKLPLLDSLIGDAALEQAAALIAAGRDDELFSAIDALALAQLASPELHAWQADNDDLHGQRVELLLQLGLLAADDVEDALTRDLPFIAALRSEEALALFDAAARLSVDFGARPALNELLQRNNTSRTQLFRDVDAVRRLIARGATVPHNAQRGTASAVRRWESADRKREKHGGHARQERGRLTLDSELTGAEVDSLLNACEAALEAVENRWPAAGRDELELLVYATRIEFVQARDRQLGAVPNDAMAFLDAKTARIVVLDPRFHDEPFRRLPGLLARELARWTIRRAHSEGSALPTWLEEGWARAYEGWGLASDGVSWQAHAPRHLAARLVLNFGAAGAGRADLDTMLHLHPFAESSGAAAWSFVRHLEQALDADGDPLFAEQLALILSSRAEGMNLDARVELRLRFTQSEAQHAAGVTTQAFLQSHWWNAEKRAATLDNATGSAAAQLWDPLDAQLARRELDSVARQLHRISAARPLDAALRLRRLRLSERRAQRDERLLEALLLARCAGNEQALVDAAWKSSAHVNHAFSDALRRRFTESRESVRNLVEAHLTSGRPEGARLLLDVLNAAMPTEPEWKRLSASLPTRGVDGVPLALTLHPLMHAHGRGLSNEAELWRRQAAFLNVRAADRSDPSDLRALWPLRAPYSVHARVALEVPVPLRSSDEHRRFGLSFGSKDELDPGAWAVLLGPAGHVDLAVRGGLEWPGRALGKAPREAFSFELRVDRASLSVNVGGRELPWQPSGPRQLNGNLGVLARQMNASLINLEIDVRPHFDPRGHWALVGGP